MSQGRVLMLMEARVDFASEPRPVKRVPLRPLPIDCPLPHAAGDAPAHVVGWVAGKLVSSASYAITISRADVTTLLPASVREVSERAFDLDQPGRTAGLLYLLSEEFDARQSATRFLTALRHDDSLDLAGVNDARGRSFNASGRRSSRRPVFVRLAAVDGDIALSATMGDLGPGRRSYCIVDAAAHPSSWNDLEEVVIEATTSAIAEGPGLSEQVMRGRLAAWQAQSGP